MCIRDSNNIFFVCLICLFVLLLFGLICVYVYHRYFSCKFSVEPYTQIFLQLNTPVSQIYLPFFTLHCNISSYTFSAKDAELKLQVTGRFLPRLLVEWPTLLVTHAALGDVISCPKSIHLSYCDAAELRSLLSKSEVLVRPLLYYSRPGFHGPKLVCFTNADYGSDSDTPCVPYPFGREDPAPSAPTDDAPLRLYPVV